MRLVFLSDTHNYNLPNVPDGDMLIHCGDATGVGTLPEVGKFLNWFGELPHPHKVFVAGNHDWLFQREPSLAKMLCRDSGVTYLEDRGTVLGGLHLYGTPWQPHFMDWAFNADEMDLAERFQHIPGGLDVLITHCPPYRIFDETNHDFKTHYIGSRDLARVVEQVKPKIHVFGHCHGGYGQKTMGGTLYINASSCDPKYRPVNPPIVVDIP